MLTACRMHRMPVPPQLWLGIIDGLAEDATSRATIEDIPPQQQEGRRPITKDSWRGMLNASVSRIAVGSASA